MNGISVDGWNCSSFQHKLDTILLINKCLQICVAFTWSVFQRWRRIFSVQYKAVLERLPNFHIFHVTFRRVTMGALWKFTGMSHPSASLANLDFSRFKSRSNQCLELCHLTCIRYVQYYEDGKLTNVTAFPKCNSTIACHKYAMQFVWAFEPKRSF